MRLIDADALIEDLELLAKHQDSFRQSAILGIMHTVKAQKTIDAVEVVRCKDCKWLYDEMDDYCCRSHRGLARICENSFCSYGERKDGDGNG